MAFVFGSKAFVLISVMLVGALLAACGGGGGEESVEGPHARITDPGLVPTATPMQDPVLFKIQNNTITTEGAPEATVVADNRGPVTTGPRRTYTVEPDDTCGAIAAKLGVSVEELMRVNRTIDSGCTNLRAGDELVIPSASTASGGGSDAVATGATATPTPARSSSGNTYTVAKGDTCEGIAASQGISVSALLAANPAVGESCTGLQIGQELTIP